MSLLIGNLPRLKGKLVLSTLQILPIGAVVLILR